MSRGIDKQLVEYLDDAHAMELQSMEMLAKAIEIAEDEETLSMCDPPTPVEQQAAELIANDLDLAVHRSLESQVDLAGPAVGRDPGPHA